MRTTFRISNQLLNAEKDLARKFSCTKKTKNIKNKLFNEQTSKFSNNRCTRSFKLSEHLTRQ